MNIFFQQFMGQSEIQNRYTAEEYFALEEQNEVRHEFFDGEVFAMAGGTKSHNLITQNIRLAYAQPYVGRDARYLWRM